MAEQASPPLWTVVLPALRSERQAATLGQGMAVQQVTIGQAVSAIDELRERIAALEAEVEGRGWDVLMRLLDKHWPKSVFPTTHEREEPERDPGPRIVALIRWVDELQAELAALRIMVETVHVLTTQPEESDD